MSCCADREPLLRVATAVARELHYEINDTDAPGGNVFHYYEDVAELTSTTEVPPWLISTSAEATSAARKYKSYQSVAGMLKGESYFTLYVLEVYTNSTRSTTTASCCLVVVLAT